MGTASRLNGEDRIPRLLVFCAHPVTGKTTLARYLENELGFIRLSWDDLEESASWPSWPDAPKPESGYDFRDGAWRQLEFFRDFYLARGRDVAVDGPATDFFAQERIFRTEHPHENWAIVLQTNRFSHRRFIRKRLGSGKHLDEALSFASHSEWDDPEDYDRSRFASRSVLRYRNWWPWDIARIQRSLRRTFGSR